MKLTELTGKKGSRTTVVIVGAGASRGASFATEVSLAPPMDADFFSTLSRLPSSEAGRKLITFVREQYGHELGISMERFFSEADYTTRFHTELKVDRGARTKKYEKALEQFYAAVADILHSTTSEECRYHRRLAQRAEVGDTFLSFNYDCILDRALRDVGGNRWNPEMGYGFKPVSGMNKWRRVTPGKPPKGSIELLKLHGSMNWLRQKRTAIALEQRLRTMRSLEGVIVPPTWFKSVTDYPFQEIWKRARLRLRRGRALVVVGYSVPITDTFSQALLKVETGSERPLELLAIVNPDRVARMRFVDLVRAGIDGKTTLVEFERLADLHAALGNSNG